MKRIGLLLGTLLFVACESPQKGNTTEEEARAVSQETLAEQAMLARQQTLLRELDHLTDSLNGQMDAYQGLITRVQDSIQFTGVHPMQQEETINRYRNVQRKLRNAADQYAEWQEQTLPDTLSTEEKNELLAERLSRLEQVKKRMLIAQGDAYRAMQADNE